MAPVEPPNWAFARLVAWRTRLLAGAVLVSALFLDVLVLGLGTAEDAAAVAEVDEVTGATTVAPTPSTVVVGIGATPRPLPSVPPTVPLVVAAPTTTAPPAPAPVAAAAPTSGWSAPAPAAPAAPAPTAAAPTTVSPAPATPIARVTPPTASPTAAPATAAPTTAAPTTAAPTTAAPTTAAPTTAAPTTAAPTTTAPPAVTVEYVTYTASSGAGDIVLAVTPDAIRLYGFYPNANWISQTEQNGPTTVKLKFFNTATERDAEWKATRDGTRIQVEN